MNKMIDTVTTINDKSLIAVLGHKNIANKDYDDNTWNNKLDPAKIMPLLTKITTNVPNNLQSCLFTILVSPKNCAEVQQALTDLTNEIVDLTDQLNWDVIDFVTTSNSLTVLNVFMTNFDYPQVISLGSQVVDGIRYANMEAAHSVANNRDRYDLTNINDFLSKLTYKYHWDDPIQYFKDQLVMFTDKPDIMNQLNQFMQKIMDADFKNKYAPEALNKMFTGCESNLIPISAYSLEHVMQLAEDDIQTVELDEYKKNFALKQTINYLVNMC